MANDRTRERKTYPFFRQRPIFEAAVSALSGGPVPTGTGFRHVTAGVEDAAAKLVENADVDAAAAIDSSKLSFAGSTPITFAMPITASLGISAPVGQFGSGFMPDGGTLRLPGSVTANTRKFDNSGDNTIFAKDTTTGADYLFFGFDGSGGGFNTPMHSIVMGASTNLFFSIGGVTRFSVTAAEANFIVPVTGLSASLTNLGDGTSYLVAGAGVSIVSESNGQVLISAPSAEGVRPTEFLFLAGLASTTLSTFSRIGARKIDLSSYPNTIGILSRSVFFYADVDKTSGATTVEIQLYDSTHAVAVTETNLTSTSTASFEVTSSALTVGSSAGNVRSDEASQYELQLKMNGGGGSDAVFCTNARLVVTYA